MKRPAACRISRWEALRVLAAFMVALSFCLAIYAEARSESRDPIVRLWMAAAWDDTFSEGFRVLGWSLLASEGVLLVAALFVLRSRDVSVPGGLPLRGRWLLRLLRVLTWFGPGVAAAIAASLAGRDPIRGVVLLVPAGVMVSVLLLTPVYLLLGVRELLTLTERDIQAAQSKSE